MLKVEYLVAVCLFMVGWIIGAYGVDMLTYLQSLDHNLIASILTMFASATTVTGIGFAYSQWRISRVDDIENKLVQIAVDRVNHATESSGFIEEINNPKSSIRKILFRTTDLALGQQGTIYVNKLVNFKKSEATKIIKTKWICSQNCHFHTKPDWENEVRQMMIEIIGLLREIDKGPSG